MENPSNRELAARIHVIETILAKVIALSDRKSVGQPIFDSLDGQIRDLSVSLEADTDLQQTIATEYRSTSASPIADENAAKADAFQRFQKIVNEIA